MSVDLFLKHHQHTLSRLLSKLEPWSKDDDHFDDNGDKDSAHSSVDASGSGQDQSQPKNSNLQLAFRRHANDRLLNLIEKALYNPLAKQQLLALLLAPNASKHQLTLVVSQLAQKQHGAAEAILTSLLQKAGGSTRELCQGIIKPIYNQRGKSMADLQVQNLETDPVNAASNTPTLSKSFAG